MLIVTEVIEEFEKYFEKNNKILKFVSKRVLAFEKLEKLQLFLDKFLIVLWTEVVVIARLLANDRFVVRHRICNGHNSHEDDQNLKREREI